jgi:transcriptional regulator with XRE-family HTH domain
MITNERQFRIARSSAERFKNVLEELVSENTPSDNVQAILRKAEIESLRSQLADLRAELAEYEALKSGDVTILEVNSFDKLPNTLVRARIASGLSHKDLAERLGIKEQQIQRYEATQYHSASLSRLLEVAKALHLNIREEVFLPPTASTQRTLFRRLGEIGLDKEFVFRRLVPQPYAKGDDESAVGRIVFHAITGASRIFGWTPAAIMGSGALCLDEAALGTARFKVRGSASERTLSAYTVYAHYLALQILDATVELEPKPIPQDPREVRQAISKSFGGLSFDAALRYVWNLGVPVLPLNDPGAFNGACWRVGGRNILVLKQRTSALGKWLEDLLHELRHAAEEPESKNRDVIELPETDPDRLESEEELKAIEFVADVLLQGRAEELVELCVEATRRRGRTAVERLKSAVPLVAEREGVPVDALANYLAFRLSQQGEDWWGAAMNLQKKGDAWGLARDILLQKVNLNSITEPDRQLVLQSLQNQE